MALRTLKVYHYKGFPVYLRHIYKNVFEFLIIEKKRFYQHSFNIELKDKQKQFTDEDFKNIQEMMMDVANNFLDLLLYQRSFKGKINNLIFKIRHGTKNWIARKKELLSFKRSRG